MFSPQLPSINGILYSQHRFVYAYCIGHNVFLNLTSVSAVNLTLCEHVNGLTVVSTAAFAGA